MSEGKQEAKEVGILQHLQANHAMFSAQRDQALANFHQLTGAVLACEQMIQQHQATLKSAVEKLAQDVAGAAGSIPTPENLGAIDNGQAKCEAKEQATKK